MALLHPYEKPATGEQYPNAYHRVLAINIDVLAVVAEVVIGVYLDEEARRAGKRPVITASTTAIGSDAQDLFSDAALTRTTPLKAAYALLRRQPMYFGAVDV